MFSSSRVATGLITCAGLLVSALPACAQANQGEVRLWITGPPGIPIVASGELLSPATGFDRPFTTNARGRISITRVPYGVYRIDIHQKGFAPYQANLEIHSALPVDRTVELGLPSVVTQVNVLGTSPLVDPDSSTSAELLGSKQIDQRLSSLPGRSVQDLINSQPGWLYEGSAVLHPRGSEYQTQFVVDGIPLTDNRSPGMGTELEADDLDSIAVYTAGFPAEYGRKMGGVIELNTRRDISPGTHGTVTLSGGSYTTLDSFAQLDENWGRSSAGVTGSGSETNHYLNPVVPQNYTNTGTTGDFSAYYQRDITANDRLRLSIRHELARFLIPNEIVQQQAGQRQNGDTFETMGAARYQHIFSANALLESDGMVRDDSHDLEPNTNPTPIAAFQYNNFREGYFKTSFTLHHGIHEFKAGAESDATFLHENFSYNVTDPDYFDPDTPPSLAFTDQRPYLEQSAWVEDNIEARHWTINAGLRWDHYQLLLNQNAFSPRLSVGRYLPRVNVVLHASYDRVFETPAYENILISGSSQVQALSPDFLRLPVQPSRGNYYEIGLTKGWLKSIRLDTDYYRRDVANFADDDQLLNTGVSYPIAFRKAVIYGAESKLTLAELHRFSGFVSYSYMVGNVWFPVTGGLFLGDDASAAAVQQSGHFPTSQDQRNTVSSRLQYAVNPRLWIAVAALYGSGLPFDFEGTEQDAIAQYGSAIVSHVNFDRGRIRPLLDFSGSIGATLMHTDKSTTNLQADVENIANRLNILDFAGLFSGNAIAPGRSAYLRLTTRF